MKSYKDFRQITIGDSDIASLVLVGCKQNQGAVSEMLNFGEDGLYKAYYVDEPCEMGEHYKLISSFESWLKIYDDSELTFHEYGDFNIYRAGEFGCIIEKVE
jgi:hypothetical protein